MSEREIFIAALHKRDAAERSAFVGDACQGDADLRQRVDGLLREHDQLGHFLESPAPLRRPSSTAPARSLARTSCGS